MNANYQNLLILTAAIIGTLLSLLLLDRWWQERVYNLNGKAVLITGGSRGLGLVLARQLIQAGARLAICARDTTELERARTELEQRGAEVLALPCDVTDRTQYCSVNKIFIKTSRGCKGCRGRRGGKNGLTE